LAQKAPDPTQTRYPFSSFIPDPESIELFGNEVGVINQMFEVTFGYQAQSDGDGIITLVERGKGICAVVGLLEKYSETYPRDAILYKWVDDLLKAAEKAFRCEKIEVSACINC
jgi:hypothetical protein